MAVLSSAALAAAPATLAAPASTSAATRHPAPGVGAWYSNQVDSLLRDSGTSWYYTWALHHDWITTPAGAEFVPMVWGRNDVTTAGLLRAKEDGTTLLGFHKPDGSGGANLSPGEALSLWSQVEGTGLRLGAPAVTGNAQARTGWLDNFMSGAASQGRRVDFIPLHWYPSTSILGSGNVVDAAVNELSQYLQAVYARFGLPLWLTEFNLISPGGSGSVVPAPAAQAEFLAAADSMMAGLSYVERWAWFSLTPFSSGVTTSLYGANNSITPAGERFRTIATAGAAPGVDPDPGGPTSAGVGAWYSSQVDSLLQNSVASWYYTWAPHHDWITTPEGCEFVPMVWGRGDATPARLQQAKANGTTLLGFNEPDLSDQADLSPQTALSLWPQLESTGLRLGAPVVATWAQAPGGWLDTFMSGAAGQGRRIDFIPLHWYPTPQVLGSADVVDSSVNELGQYLQAVHTRYGLPLWLTEFSLIGWSSGTHVVPESSVQAQFLVAADSMMAAFSYVERYAWFSLTPLSGAPGASLYAADNSVTAAGQQFRTIPRAVS